MSERIISFEKRVQDSRVTDSRVTDSKIKAITEAKTQESRTQESRTRERLEILKTYKLYIDGKFPRTESGRYYVLQNSEGKTIANVCRASRKDFRDAVTSARQAQTKWAGMPAYHRGQILYRIAEMLEGRRTQFVEELVHQGSTPKEAQEEINTSIDRLIYYAGWADKYQQIFSAVNPVASSHFNFSMLEPTGVVAMIGFEESSLLGLVTAIAPTIVGGNTCVVLASETKPLSAMTFAEVIHSSDVPAGVVNILTGYRKELLTHFSSHMDINAIIYCGENPEEIKTIQQNAILNLKRVILWTSPEGIYSSHYESPYRISETQEVKTTWHPMGL